jgi:hypothetical protein
MSLGAYPLSALPLPQRQERPQPEHQNGYAMTPPRPNSHSEQLRAALEHARRLTSPRPAGAPYTASWSAQANQVGDITVLALAALRD